MTSVIVYEEYCTECGGTVGYTTETKQYQEEHYFNDAYGGGRCGGCGYACTHEKVSWEDADEYTATDYIVVDGQYHKRVEQKVEEVECPDCGKWFERNVGDPVETTEEHVLSDLGYCTECGADLGETCAHEHVSKLYDWVNDYDGAIYREENGECYLVEAWMDYAIVCDDCCKRLTWTS